MKYALTCAVRGAVKAKANTAEKMFYMKQIKKGVAMQKVEVATARKLACIVWKMLTTKRRYVEEDAYLTRRKAKRIRERAREDLQNATRPEDVAMLAKGLESSADVLEQYPEDMAERMLHRGHRCGRKALRDKGARIS